jgi:hypothetical protein
VGETWETRRRRRKRSYSASSSSDSGSSFEAATRQRRGTRARVAPLSNSRSFSSVSSVFKIAELALKISSTKATCASGRYPRVCRT